MYVSNIWKIVGRRCLTALLPTIFVSIQAMATPIEIRDEVIESQSSPAAISQRRVVAYVTSWSHELPDPRLMTNINYAFGHVNDTFDGVEIDNPSRLRDIADLKRLNPDLEVMLSIGGWGSGRFSEMAADSALRARFAEDCRRVMTEYALDGIDIDWEYPTCDWAGISASTDDTGNFTLLMRDLRNTLPQDALLTLASVHNASYIDFSAINPYVDFVNIMSYDMATPPGHHSPLHASPVCGDNSAETAFKAHLAAGMPAGKLTLGLPFYGRGREPYNDFVDYNAITVQSGCTEHWDSIAMAPYISDSDGKFVLGYDNVRSIGAKCDFIKANGMLGAMYWDYAGDNGDNELRSAVAQSMMADGYPANYAKAPRFNALVYYSDMAESAHVDFARQAIEFFHRLSYGEGYTYKVTTSLDGYIDRLSDFDVIISINTMPGDAIGREAFERYMENGGGWVGFHAAGYNDASTHWPWFNRFLGAGVFYCNTWPPQPALLDVGGGAAHPVTRNLPSSFVAPACEWYQWIGPSPCENEDVEVLLSLSPRNYPIGIKDIVSHGDFPVVWSNRRYRMIYLNMGHGDEEFTDATQNLLFVNAFRWIVSRSPKGNPFK